MARACNVITRFLSLLQRSTNLVSFIRRMLTLVEQEYPVIERELLALLVGYKSSLHFLNGRHVTLQRSEKSIGSWSWSRDY
jgi:hypothetical protein